MSKIYKLRKSLQPFDGKTSLFRRFEWLIATLVHVSETNCSPEYQSIDSKLFIIL